MRNASLPLSPLTGVVELAYDGVPIELKQVVQTAHRVTGLGTVYEPLVVVPAISVAVSPGAGVVPLTEKTLMVTAKVKSNVKGKAAGTVRLELPAGWHAQPEHAEFALAKDGDSVELPFTVTPGNLTETTYTMTAVASYEGKEYREGYRTVGYAGLLPANIYRPASYRATGVDVKVAPGLKAAYSISNAFIKSTTTSEPYCGCFFSTLDTGSALPQIHVLHSIPRMGHYRYRPALEFSRAGTICNSPFL